MSDDVAANLDRQRELYGEPLRVIAERVMGALGLTQGRLAEAMGLSAPMLSQLLSGRRVKIGNPAVVRRLEILLEMVDDAPALSADEIVARVAAVRDVQGTFTTARTPAPVDDESAMAALRHVASAAELADAAAALTDRQPRLAALLRQAAAGTAGG